MKNNTQRTKDLLAQALRALPGDNALQEAKTHINIALSKLEQVEKKRIKRTEAETSHQRWWSGLNDGITRLQVDTNLSFNPTKALNAIDGMIADTQNKLAASRTNKDNKTNGDFQTFLN